MNQEKIKVCGAGWCGDTRSTLRTLNDLKVPYNYIDIEKDKQAEQWVRDHNDGKLKRPTLDINGTILVEPDEALLVATLTKQGLIPSGV